MRENVCRAKTKDTKVWIEGYYACESNHACFGNELKYTHFIFKDEFLDWGIGGLVQCEIIPETAGRYAGLRDSKRTKEYPNGQMIFEGDIVTHYINWLGERIKGVVEYDTKLASWMCRFGDDKEKESAFLCDWVDNNGCEIIGNIHDNPELLKAGDNDA